MINGFNPQARLKTQLEEYFANKPQQFRKEEIQSISSLHIIKLEQ